MKSFILILLSVIAANQSTDTDRRIYRGHVVAGTVPWQVAILYPLWEGFRCGGSILTREAILTAAHCYNVDDAEHLVVKVGSNLYDHGGVDHIVHNVYIHPEYDGDIVNDIALIKLASHIMYNARAGPIPLITRKLEQGDGPLTTTGWGATLHGEDSLELKISDSLYIVGLQQCRKAWTPYPIWHSQICTTGNHSGTCQGDSGGPVTYKGWLVGVTSASDEICGETRPIIFTNVFYFREWILDTYRINFRKVYQFGD